MADNQKNNNSQENAFAEVGGISNWVSQYQNRENEEDVLENAGRDSLVNVDSAPYENSGTYEDTGRAGLSTPDSGTYEGTENAPDNETQITEQADGQKVYSIIGHGNALTDEPKHAEMYTEQQIENMRKEVAMFDSQQAQREAMLWAGAPQDNIPQYQDFYDALSDGTYAEANPDRTNSDQPYIFAGSMDSENFDMDGEDKNAQAYGKGEHQITIDGGENWVTYENKLDVPADEESWGEEGYHRTGEEIEHMREILAEVDTAEGKGNYEDNLEALKTGSYLNDAESVKTKEESTSYENDDVEEEEEAEKETDDEPDVTSETESETSPQNVYRVKLNHYDDRQEAYTSDDIEKMKDLLAEHDGMSREEFDTYTEGAESEQAEGQSLEYDGTRNGEKAGVLGETAEYDGKTLSYTNHSGKDSTLEITNDFDMDNISPENLPQEAWDKMAQIVAVADACDGNGNYEDNINQLKIYDYSHQKEMQDGAETEAYEEAGLDDEIESTNEQTKDEETVKNNDSEEENSEKTAEDLPDIESLSGTQKAGPSGIREITPTPAPGGIREITPKEVPGGIQELVDTIEDKAEEDTEARELD